VVAFPSLPRREFTIATKAVPDGRGLRRARWWPSARTSARPDNQTPLCIHRAPLGTHERFIGFLIESRACERGNFPLWLAPDQVRVITLNDDEALSNYAQPIVAELRANMVRVDADYSATPFKARISNAELGGARLLTSRLARTLAPPVVATLKPPR